MLSGLDFLAVLVSILKFPLIPIGYYKAMILPGRIQKNFVLGFWFLLVFFGEIFHADDALPLNENQNANQAGACQCVLHRVEFLGSDDGLYLVHFLPFFNCRRKSGLLGIQASAPIWKVPCYYLTGDLPQLNAAGD